MEEKGEMKRKHKIEIGSALLSLSLVTAMTTGLINTGNLFAEDPETFSSNVSFQPGDMIMLGGQEFTVLDSSGKLLSKENAGKIVKYAEVESQLTNWENQIQNNTELNSVITNTSKVPTYEDLGGENLVPNLGNGSVFWTKSAGNHENTRIAINEEGTARKTVELRENGSMNTTTFACDGAVKNIDFSENDIVIGEKIETTCQYSRTVGSQYYTGGDGYAGYARAYVDSNANITVGQSNCASIYSALKDYPISMTSAESIMGTIGEQFVSTHFHENGSLLTDHSVHGIASMMRRWGAPALSSQTVNLITAGNECNNSVSAGIAALRPSIEIDPYAVLFITNQEGSPVNVNPQVSAANVVLYDNNIEFQITPEQSKKIETITGEVIKLDYASTTVGTGHSIKLIVKDSSGNAIRYVTLEDVSSNASGKLSIDTGKDGLNLPLGKYTLQLFNEKDNSGTAGISNHASAIVEIPLELQQGLSIGDITESGVKLDGTDFYNEDGVTFTINNTTENGNIGNTFPYIRVGTLSELNDTVNPKPFVSNSVKYLHDGVYERKTSDDVEIHPDGYTYDDCLYVQLSSTADGSGLLTTKLPLNSVKIDSKSPYFPSGKNGEDKPITTENIKDEVSSVSFFSAVFGEQPSSDLDEEFAGEHTKIIPHANDYEASMYEGGKLKSDAVPLKDGIVSYEMIATPLGADGMVDDTLTSVTQTIQTSDDKFNGVEPYFELKGKNAYWVKITATDRAGRTATAEEKLYMDSTKPGIPEITANLQDDGKTVYEGGELENEQGEKIPNWSAHDISVALKISDIDLKELKSGIDRWEYITSKEIKRWVDDGKKAEDIKWHSLGKKNDADGKEIAENIFKTDSAMDSEDNEYHFRAVSRANIYGEEKTFIIKKDKSIPNLDVKAIDVDTKADYVEGVEARKGIKFTITPSGDVPVSGVTYYYRGVPSDWTPTTRAAESLPSDEEIPWIEIKKNEVQEYSFLISDGFEGTYYFKAVSGANVTTKAVDVKKVSANVGVVQPKTPITASTTIDLDGSAYDGKWTKEDLTITLEGGLDGADTPAYYEYADSPTATTWTKIASNNGKFKLKISGEQTMNKSLYFRVVKNGDPDEIPYATTKSGLKIRHDAVVPMIKSVTMDPQSPDVATSFVKLKVVSVEKSSQEAANASPIAAYSIDDGATWINANSKVPNEFTYEFTENTSSVKIKVKDEAGNIAEYGTTLVVDNIDKTGPSSPEFENSSEFKNGIWKKEAQDVIMNFTPADTGADEWIQYHVQKQVNNVYESYDPVNKTTGGEVEWINAPIKQAKVTLTLYEEGTYRIIARTIDSMKRVSAESITTDIIRIDMTAPTISDITEVEDKWAASATNFLNMLTGNMFFKDHITYTFTGSDNAGGSGLNKYQYQLASADAIQPADDAWVDAHKGEVNIEKDFVGKLYVRSVDNAGNLSNTVVFDGIQVDATLPSLKISPVDLSANWTNTNSIVISAEDKGSGIKDNKVVYTTTYSGTEAFTGGDLTLDGNGKAVLNDLPDGEYSLEFTVSDESSHVETIVYPVKIDTGTSDIAIIDKNTDSIVTEKEITIEVQNTIGGQKELNVTLDGKALNLTASNKAPEVLTGDHVTVYTAKITENGVLEAEVVGNTLHDGSNVRAAKTVDITNVYSVEPRLKVEAFTGKDETRDRYESGEWTTENVEIVLNNTETAIKTSSLTFQYKEFDAQGTEITHGWTDIEDTDTSTKTGRFSVYGNGKREYHFRAVLVDPTDPAKKPILESDEEVYLICQDTKRPAAPVLDITEADDYTQEKWYDRAKVMEISFSAETAGLGQWVEYKDESDNAPKWNKAELNQTSGKYEIRVKGDKKHVIKIRSNDRYDRSSVESIAYVNIDTSTPVFDVSKKFTSSNALLTLETVDDKGNSIIGISGLYDATIQKKTDGILEPDTLQHFYGGKATITKDAYGNGTYEVTLITNSGKTVKKDIEVNGINLPKPVINVKGSAIATDTSETPYTSGTWIHDPKVRLEVEVKNQNVAGTVTNEYQIDGDNKWTAFANDGKDMTLEVSGSGRHAINIRSTNESGAVSDTYYFNVWIDDMFVPDFTIQNEERYSIQNTPWYNKTQTIQATFAKDEKGSREWIEYSEDNGKTWIHNNKDSYTVSSTGIHELLIRKNDEMGSGNNDTGKRINVYIDKELIKDFKVRIDTDSYSQFLNTITFGVFHKEAKEAIISGNFGISGSNKVYYQVVSDPSEYVNTYENDTNDGKGWKEYTDKVQLGNDFKGFVYAKARDKAGNTTNIIRTDGIVIDTVAPVITIDNHNGEWMTDKTVEVSVSDFSDGVSVVGNASGIQSISYETDEATPKDGTVEVEDNLAKINDLNDGEYKLTIIGKDKAGNETREEKQMKLDRIMPKLTIEGYTELDLTSSNLLTLKPVVGASGVKSLKMKAELRDGSTISETLTGPDYTYNAVKNGTYTFTLTNNAGVMVTEVLEVNNITSQLDDIMGLSVQTKDLDGETIDYLNAEKLPGKETNPEWTSSNVIFTSHGSIKFKGSIDGGRYSDFAADGTFTVSNEGVHTVSIRNNTDTTERIFVVKIDKYKVKDVKIADSYKYTAHEWFNDKRIIQGTFTPDDTGIDEWIEYYDASRSKWVRSDSVIVEEDGTHTVRIRGNDELNRPTDEEQVIVNVDKTAPTDLKIKLEKSATKDFINHLFPNIFNEAVEVSIHANGDISGNRKIEYQVIDETIDETFNELIGWNTYEGSFTIPDGFKGKVYARAIDNAGNKTLTAVTEDGIIVDTNTPEIMFQTNPMTTWSNENKVKATISPTLSGLQSAWYTITKNGIVTKYDIDLNDIDALNNITLENLPNGKYEIEISARNKAGNTGSKNLQYVMFENRAPLLNVDADLEKKATSILVTVDVDMSNLNSTLVSLTWQTSGTSPQDILTDKKFTINNNGVYKIVATTSSGVTAEKTLVVTNITNVSSMIGFNAYYSKDHTSPYLGGDTWSDKDITIEARDIVGKIPTEDLMMEMRIINLKDNTATGWTVLDADKSDAALYKVVATDEGSYVYEFRGKYEGVAGATSAFQVNIDRSAPKKPLFANDTLKKYDNDKWLSEYDAELKANIDATEGCDEWLEYNIDGATDFDGNPLWLPTNDPSAGTIKVVDDKDHTVKIRTTDRLDRHSEVNELHVKMDSTRPTEFYIKEGENKYQDFLDKLTGGIFYKGSRTIEIGGNFKISGVNKIEYQIVKNEADFKKDGTWKKLNIANGDEFGTFQLLPGAKGIIYARGIDKAGNETGIIRSDMITVDNSFPLLIVPADATEWSNNTTMKIKVKDDESGIQSVTYKSEDNEISGDVVLSDQVDSDGYREGTITNLKDGRYKVEIMVTNGAGMTQTELPVVMIDTVTPDLKFEGQTSKPQTSTTLDLIPIVGGSGLHEIQVLDKKDDGTYSVISTIQPNADGSEKYPYEFIENGTYYFKVVNGNGIESDEKEITISNIKSDTPVIVFRTDNGYDPKTWSGNSVILETSTNTNAKLYYRVKGATDWIEADKIYYQNLPFRKTGIYTYEFKSVFEGVGGAANIETTAEYTVKVDLEAPKKPFVQNLQDYDQWYKLDKNDPANPIGKIVTLVRDTSDYTNGTKYGDGSKETVYYNIEGKVDAQGNPEWIEVENDKVNITDIGDNKVTFKIIDEVTGHETFSDPVHVKIYEEDPTITLTDTTKPVKTFDLSIAIDGNISKEDQVKKLTVERVGSEPVDIQPEQDVRKYNFPISKNGTYIVRVEMEFGGSAIRTLNVTNIIEEDPILDVTAISTGTNTNYNFGTWSTSAVKLTATDPKSTSNMIIKVRNKVLGGIWSQWVDYNGDIDVDTSGTHIYQFMTVLAQGADKYETIMDETYVVKVDLTKPEEVTIDQFDTYKDPNKWTSSSVNLTTTFNPKNDGAKEWVEYSLDDGTTWIKKNSVLISKEGKNTIIFRSVDEAGQETRVINKDTVYVNIDKTSAGSVSMQIANDAVVSGNPNNITFDKFYKSSDTVTLSMLDDKGIAVTTGTIYYQFADGHNGLKDDQWQAYSGPVTLTAGFKGSIYAYAVNQSGKSTDVVRSNGITVDDQAPTIKTPSADMTKWNKSNSLEVEIEDKVSGVDSTTVKYTTYADNATATQTATGSINLIDGKGTIPSMPNGEYYIEISASDNAGNAVTSSRFKIMIDAEQYAFNLSQAVNGDHKTISANVTTDMTGLSGIKGVYIRNSGSSWAFMGNTPTVSYDVYKNGLYEVKVVNNAGKESAIQQITVNDINDLPDFDLKTTDGFDFGDFWYQPLTIEVLSNDADAIYYSTSGKDGPWKNYKDKIEINETSAYQYIFKVVKGDKELVSMPYDVRVIIKQAEGANSPVVLKERNVRMFMRSVFTAFSEEKEEWRNTGTRITFTPSSSTAPGLKAGTFIQVLEVGEHGEGIGYNEKNFTLVDENHPEYIFHNDGRYVVYQFYAYYKEGEEDNPSKPADITKTYYNIDGTNPESLKLTAEMNGSSTILNDLTGGLYFKEPVKIIPEGSDSLSGIDHYEFQSISCNGDEYDLVKPSNGNWETTSELTVPQNFEGIVYVRAVDGAKNFIEKSVRLAVKDDVTTYKILEDISNWTNTKDLNIEVTPSTTGLQELNYKVFDDDKEGEVSTINIPATDTERKLYTIHDIPEGVYNLKVIPVENGGTSISKGAHALKVDRTKPVVQVEFTQNNDTEAAKLMNKLTLNGFYRPGLIVTASATDFAGDLEIDAKQLKIEYSLNGGEWKEYTTSLKFDQEEVVDLSFRAIDQAGNISDIVTKDGIAVDASAPTFQGASNNVTYWLPRTVTVKDNMSGIDAVKVNEETAGSTVLIRNKGVSRIEASDRSGNESSLAFTVKGLDDIKDEDINNELIEEIEKEFEEQKPGYDKELADEIQKQIDDLKDRNKDTSNPDDNNQGDKDNNGNSGDDSNKGDNDNNGNGGNDSNGGNGGSTQNPDGDKPSDGGNSNSSGTDGNGSGDGSGSGSDINGSGSDGTHSGTGDGSGSNGSGSGSNGTSNGSGSSTINTGTGGQGSSVVTTGTSRTPTSGGVKTSDTSSVFTLVVLGLLSLLLAMAIKLKQRLNELQQR